MACDEVLDSTFSSDRISGCKAFNKPFVMIRSIVTATQDMGVGHGGLTKLCCYLDTPVMHESAQIVWKVYKEFDPSVDESGVIDHRPHRQLQRILDEARSKVVIWHGMRH